ncbi:hypothetical protein JCM10207_005730 [Rhodosporidiobolus poonsookiae]
MSYPPYGAVGSSSSTSRGQFDPARANGGAQPGLPPSLTSSSAPADAFSFISPSHPPAPVPSGLPSTSQAMWSVESASSHDERERPGDEIASVSDIGPSYGGIGGAADASALAYGSGIDDEAVGGSSSRSGKRAASVAFSTGETRSPGSTGGANARSAAACTYCRKQKMKCDGPLARPCRRCRIAQVECIFDDPSLGPKKGTTKIRSNAQAQALLEGAAPYPDFYARETALAFSASQAHHQPPVHVPHRPESALSGFSSGMTGVVKSEPRADGRDE